VVIESILDDAKVKNIKTLVTFNLVGRHIIKQSAQLI